MRIAQHLIGRGSRRKQLLGERRLTQGLDHRIADALLLLRHYRRLLAEVDDLLCRVADVPHGAVGIGQATWNWDAFPASIVDSLRKLQNSYPICCVGSVAS